MLVFLESEIPGLSWETRIHNNNYSKVINKKYSIIERSELFSAGLFSSSLFVWSYIQDINVKLLYQIVIALIAILLCNVFMFVLYWKYCNLHKHRKVKIEE